MIRNRKYATVSGALLFLAVLAFAVAFWSRSNPGTGKAVRRTERALASRLKILGSYEAEALEADPSQWLDLGKLPQDMVIYRYRGDTLDSWVNRFPTANDQLSSGVLFQSLVNPRYGMRSPMNGITGSYSYCNIGPKWYLARSLSDGPVTVISGLEIMNSLDMGGINPRLRVPENCSVQELSSSGGYPVNVDGRPIFKLLNDSPGNTVPANMPWLWAALLLFLAASFFFICAVPGIRSLCTGLAAMLAALAVFYFTGPRVSANSGLFSPLLYADGRLLYSLGAVVILSLALTLPVWSFFIARKEVHEATDKKPGIWFRGLVMLVSAAVIVVFTYAVIRSITLNSGINLEIYKIKELSRESILVYVLLIMLLSCIPMLLHMMQPVMSRLFGFHLDFLSVPNRIIFALLVAVYLVSVSASLGFRKEQASLEVWANRLAVSRDIRLEMQLRSAEERIARDAMIASLSVLDNAGASIRNRIADNYLQRVAQEYDMIVTVGARIDPSLLSEGEIITPGSRFIFREGADGLVSYTALFVYDIANYGTTSVMLRVEQKGDWRYRGYAGILGESAPGEVLIPSSYAFARYQGRSLLTFRGNYAYPVRMDDSLSDSVYAKGDEYIRRRGFTHFIYVVADAECVVVSRRTISAFNYAVSGIFIALLAFLIMSLFPHRRRELTFERTYFSSRLSWIIMVSLTMALVSIAVVSVYFVYERNDQNRRTLMTEKINSIAASISSRLRGARTTEDLRNNEVHGLIEDVGNSTNSDVTLYSPSGLVIMSTAPTVFERNLMDSRIDGEAYRNIMLLTSRYYIQKESVGKARFYCMYAPLVGEDGEIIAIICSPYTDDTYEFETSAVNHSITIISVFILLLLLASFMTRGILERMFQPLLQMGRKMEGANLDSLEYIKYDKQDEITSLVNAYNRMVTDLSESSRQLAEAERDKAWSGMARQVAHEIKNPLTPMKLQIQRLARLKAKGDPSWQDKFDEVSKVLLDHIDILTDTANDFSTFAKLYTEEPSVINLDNVLREEIAMFDGRENVSFEYMGLEDAVVTGPKPQLTRVFVNLINNAVQAVEGKEDARIVVSLRNSIGDGYYDIVFEDNGPGVSEENTGRLFEPNFTTKTGGSGLGLAISRSILQKCEATIGYSRSFALGGACFTVHYPKNK